MANLKIPHFFRSLNFIQFLILHTNTCKLNMIVLKYFYNDTEKIVKIVTQILFYWRLIKILSDQHFFLYQIQNLNAYLKVLIDLNCIRHAISPKNHLFDLFI